MSDEITDEDIKKYLFRIGIKETTPEKSMKIVRKLTAPIVDYLNKNDNIPHGIFISQMIVDTVEKSFMDQLIVTFKKVNDIKLEDLKDFNNKDCNEKGRN